MKVRVRIEPTGDGRWMAWASGFRGFGVSPTLGDSQAAAAQKARAAVLFGLSCASDDGLVRAPDNVTFVTRYHGGRAGAPTRTRRRRVQRNGSEVLAP